jgi:hypothetical protein
MNGGGEGPSLTLYQKTGPWKVVVIMKLKLVLE